MSQSLVVARVHDGLPLAASMDDDQLARSFADFKSKSRSVLKSLRAQEEPMCTIDAGIFVFYSLVLNGVGYVCLCDKVYPKRLAFSFLDEVSKQFEMDFSRDQIEGATRPYAFLRFDTFIQKLRRSFQDVRSQDNLTRLHNELVDVQHVMQTSLQEVLERGNKLEHMSLLSSNLSSESKRFAKDAHQLNIDMLLRTYGPPSVVIIILLFIMWIWYRYL